MTEEKRAEEFKEFCRGEIARCQSLLLEILGTSGSRGFGPRTSANTLEPLNKISMILGNVWNLAGLLRCVHPDPALREASEESEKEIARFANELSLHRELFEAASRCDPSTLDRVGKRMLEQVLRDFRRSGVDRDEATREKVRALKEELVALGQDFTRNIANDVRSILLDGPQELEGLPEDYLRGHAPKDSGKIRVTTNYPDYNPFMTYARSGKRRKELYTEFRRRAHPMNLEVLDKILLKRHELAAVLGYPSWAAYVVEDKMIKSPEAISQFINRVSKVAEARARSEYEILLEQKRMEEGQGNEVHDWEKAYYEDRVRSERFHVDSKEVRAYFEYDRVKRGILSLTEELFGVRFQPVPESEWQAAGQASAFEPLGKWHPEVEVLDVFENGRRVGRVYFDMHPREGKFKHAAMFPLVRGVKGSAIPEAALVCNFPNPRATQGPALLDHDDVVTFFHEFGHLLHHLFARDQEWVKFSGTAMEWDFVEVPSQLYEEWAWDYEVLRRFTAHHGTGEAIPKELVERLQSGRDFGRALWVRHQMFYAAVSLKCYGNDPSALDTSSLIEELQNQYSLFRFVDGTYFQASFGHLDDYSALYYTYMWSLVIEKDLFEEFKKGGSMSRETAARYRNRILAPGGSADATELVRSFLGRDYAFSAFEKWLGSY
jgi:thimet oligopeptidase